ncbi:hypothetical protein JW859_06575 [bacterium]|nr:hypothetical protein [bacterium]
MDREPPQSPEPPQYQQPYQPPPGPPPGTYPPHYQPPPPPPVQNNNTKLIWIIVGVACGCPLLIVIIGIIMTVSVPMFLAAKDNSEHEQARTYLRTVMSAEAAYYATHGEYCGVDDLVDGNYLDFDLPPGSSELAPGISLHIGVKEDGQGYEAIVTSGSMVFACDETGEIRE